MRVKRYLAATAVASALFGAATISVGADNESSTQGIEWLQRMTNAAKSLNYNGVFSYQSGRRAETSRITHVQSGSGLQEKLEALDGTPREVVRVNNEVHCFWPASKLMIVDRPKNSLYAGRWLNDLSTLADNYRVVIGRVGRVAGRDAQLIVLEPRDNLRYAHNLWADKATGFLLKARMLNDRGESVEQFAFSQIYIGNDIPRDSLKPSYAQLADWKVVSAQSSEVKDPDLKWEFRNLPSGYRKVGATRLMTRGDGSEAFHTIFSDGLATISVFVEVPKPQSATPTQISSPPPLGAGPHPHHAQLGFGATNIYKRSLGSYQVTFLGEVPELALQRVAESMELRP